MNFIQRHWSQRAYYFFNLISTVFIFGLTFLFVKDFYFDKKTILGIIFCFSISFIVSYFILSKFTFSKNFVIGFIQKTVIFYITFLIIISFCYYIGLIETIYCLGPG